MAFLNKLSNNLLNKQNAARPQGLGRQLALGLLLTGSALGSMVTHAELSLSQAVATAQQNDPWLEGSQYRENALVAMSTAASTLPDPVLSVGMANLPTDSFDFDQEAMTQFKVGVSQTIPRGSSLELSRERLSILSSQQPYLRQDRMARVAVDVSHLWLETYRARETIRLIEQDRELFEHLVDVAQSSYSSGFGKVRQQDIVRAQLELTRLDDRLTVLRQQFEESRSSLGEWLLPRAAKSYSAYPGQGSYRLPASLPGLSLVDASKVHTAHTAGPQSIAPVLLAHPAILNLDRKIDASATGIRIAEQDYKPEWQLNASYGYREDAPDGMDRADFFSVGVSVDLPLFTSSRQDQRLKSAVASTEAVRTERALLLRRMLSQFDRQRARLLRLDQRQALYSERLLAEIHEQAEASLTAYTNDDGDFSEVVRSRIDELNARIDSHNIEIDRLKTIAQLNYFFAAADTSPQGEQL